MCNIFFGKIWLSPSSPAARQIQGGLLVFHARSSSFCGRSNPSSQTAAGLFFTQQPKNYQPMKAIKKASNKIKTTTKASAKPARKTQAATAKPIKRTTKVAVKTAPVITTDAIAACAYTLWEQSGRPHGRDAEFWFQAEQKLKQETRSLAA
jgi:hypothetical protein